MKHLKYSSTLSTWNIKVDESTSVHATIPLGPGALYNLCDQTDAFVVGCHILWQIYFRSKIRLSLVAIIEGFIKCIGHLHLKKLEVSNPKKIPKFNTSMIAAVKDSLTILVKSFWTRQFLGEFTLKHEKINHTNFILV